MNNLLTQWQTNAFLISLLSLTTFGGCAQSFNNSGLSELVAEPTVQTDFGSRQRKALSDLKVDPLAFEPLNKVTESDLGHEKDWGHLASLPAFGTENEAAEPVASIPNKQAISQSFTPANSPEPPPSIVRLEPIMPDEPMPMTPVVSRGQLLQPINETFPETIELKALPQQVVQEQTVSEIPSVDFAPANIVATVGESETAPSQSTSQLVSTSNELPTIAPTVELASEMDNKNDFAPNATSRRVTEFTPEVAAQDFVMETQPAFTNNQTGDSNTTFERDPQLDEFVSEQMQMLLPPFASHPDSEQLREYLTQAAASPSEAEPPTTANYLAEQGTADPLNNFVEALIETTMAPTADKEIKPSSAEKTEFVPAPPAPIEPVTWSEQVSQTIEAFESEINISSGQRRNNLERGLTILQALRASLTQPLEDSAMTHDLQQYWQHQLNALKSITAADATSEDFHIAATTALTDLNQAASRLRNSADLLLKSECFCRKVDGFGQYETYGEAIFGPKQQVLVYCELENFTPLQETALGNTNFMTKISSSFWIINENGETVQTTDYPVVTDNARKLRRDFFMHLPIRFAELEPGRYELQVEVRDFGNGKTAQFTTPLQFQIR